MMVAVDWLPLHGEQADALLTRWGADGGRRASVLARAVLRGLLAATVGGEDWRIEPDHRGKPGVIDGRGRSGPAVSLSHSGGLVTAAVAAEGLLGIDLEQHRPRDVAALAAYALSPAECSEVADGGAAAFYRLWTRREALAKATGAGLTLAANGRDLDFAGWHIHHCNPLPDYSLTIAWRGPSGEAPIWRLSPPPRRAG